MQGFAKEHQINLGRDGLFDLLREHNLLIRKRRRKAQTTFSKHWYKKYKNLIRGFEPLAPNLLWVSDITYIVIADGFAYLGLAQKLLNLCYIWVVLPKSECKCKENPKDLPESVHQHRIMSALISLFYQDLRLRLSKN